MLKPANDNQPTLTAEQLRGLLNYDRETGEFTRRVERGGEPVCAVAGYFDKDGYREIRVNGKAYKAHRLAWLYVHGEWPERNLDHIDVDPSNNRISNLRLATQSQNNANRGVQSNNTSGYKGVSWHPSAGKWCAHIQHNGKKKYLGLFTYPEGAYEAYKRAANDLFGEFARVA